MLEICAHVPLSLRCVSTWTVRNTTEFPSPGALSRWPSRPARASSSGTLGARAWRGLWWVWTGPDLLLRVFKCAHITTVSVHRRLQHERLRIVLFCVSLGSPAWAPRYCVINSSFLMSAGLDWRVDSSCQIHFYLEKQTWRLGGRPFYIWDGSSSLCWQLYDSTEDKEWMTTCVHEHCFVLWELINDKLCVIYIFGNVAGFSSWMTYSECDWVCKLLD